MTSLRARLILAFAAVAVVPLVIAVVWLGQRLQDTVRDEADARLRAALARVEARIGEERSRVTGRLAKLAADPEVRRLYLLGRPTEDELHELLDRQAALLDLDIIELLDRDGRPQARVGKPILSGATVGITGDAPITYLDERAGALHGGVFLDSTRLARLGEASGVALVLRDGLGHTSAVTDPDFAGPTPRTGRFMVHGEWHLARTIPVDVGGQSATLTALAPTLAADAAIASLNRTALVLGLAGLAIAILLGWFWSRRISLPVERLAAFSERIARGEWDEPLRADGAGEVRTLVASLDRMRRDLGDYRERLRAGERQAAYGRMAREVAHEIRNPLTPIAVSVADLRRTAELGRPELPQVLDETTRVIDQEVQRLKRLLESFATLGRVPEPQLAAVDLGVIVRDLAPLYAADGAAGRIAFTPASAPLPVRADRDQLEQALVNLVQNALEAVPAGGPVEVRASRDRDAAEVAVSDHGPGLTDEQRARLCVPGYTTKPNGSGIGLATVDRIVAGHGGRLFVDSTPGRGTTFRIRLPLANGDSPWPRS